MSGDQNDDWRALEESLGIENAYSPDVTGELALPALRKKEEKKSKKIVAARNPPVKLKVKQTTLGQPTLSEAEFEKQMERLRLNEQRNEEDMDGIEYEKYLQDDDDSDSGGEETANTDGFGDMSSGILEEKLGLNQTEEEMHSQHENPPRNGEMQLETESRIGLNDETFDFGTKNTFTKPKKTTGAGYRIEESSQEAVRVSVSLNESTSQQKENPVSDLPNDLFYWFDAKEQPHSLSVDPGSIFLFGKIYNKDRKQFQSCCIRVRNTERVFFALPTPGSSDSDVIHELNDLCRMQGIEKRRMKFVERFYGFEDNTIPHDKCRWVKVRYPGSYPQLTSRSNLKNIKAILGSSSSLLELFLLKRRMKGPCFLRVDRMAPVANKISHCALEYTIESPKLIHVDESQIQPPPFLLASVQLHTQLDNENTSNEVVMISIAVYKDVHVDQPLPPNASQYLTGVRCPSASVALPLDLEKVCRMKGFQVQRFKNEQSLLSWLACTLKEIDPDMLIGHNFVGFTLNTLLHRYQEFGVSEWSTLGRLDLKRFPRLQSGATGTFQEREVCCGRLIVDSYSLSREYFKSTNYKLLALSKEMNLKGIAVGGTTFEPGTTRVTSENWSSSSQLFEIILQLCHHAVLSMNVVSHLDVIRLTKRLSSIAGNLWSRTLYGARSERIEYLLLHAFHALKFITPDKRSFDTQKRQREEATEAEEEDTKRKSKYQGGMVLEPKCGLYSDYILLLDFNSLYPSLIQEFNICFTTVDRWGDAEVEVPAPERLICRSCASAGLPSPCAHRCVLPRVIKSLVDQRREVKRLMKSERDPNQLSLLEIRQKALKLTANSMYGCLGFEFSRFFAQPLAELVTRQGRLALQNAVEMVPQLQPSLRVIYGDTDSVMIQTGIKNDIAAVRQLGLSLKADINKKYQSLEIDIDGVFRSILLLKKKKYAALSVLDWNGAGKTYKEEVKGLDMVRRDWCPLSKKVSDAVLKRVLHAEAGEDVLDFIMKYMGTVAEKVRSGTEYGLDDFVISKSLTKEPESYKGNGFPHASVALRMRKRRELVRVGDLIPYVICCSVKEEGAGNRPIGERAYHVEEVRQQKTPLQIDAEWYLTSQIYPPVVRLCEHIQGFTPLQLSEVMGLPYHGSSASQDPGEGVTQEMDFGHCSFFKQRPVEECFPGALPLQVGCSHCGGRTPVNPHQRVYDVVEKELQRAKSTGNHERVWDTFELYVCTRCGGTLNIHYVANCLSLVCHGLLQEFYSRGGSVSMVRALRQQLTYFRALFDVPRVPGCSTALLHAHYSRALRCVALGVPDHFTLEDAAIDEREEEDSENKRFIVDPVFLCIESYYNRVEHLFVSLESLF